MSELPFIDQALACRIELASAWRGVRYAEAYLRLHPTGRSGWMPLAGGYAIFIHPDSPVNHAGALGLQGPVTQQDIEAMEAFFLRRGARPKIHVCPLADESLFDLLHDGGYRISGFFSVLARRLPEDFTPAPLPAGLRVRSARPDEAGVWLRVVGQGFEERETPSREALDILGPNFHAEDGLPFFAFVEETPAGGTPAETELADGKPIGGGGTPAETELADGKPIGGGGTPAETELADGKPIGGGGMYYNIAQRVVELGGASTLTEYRRRGVQRALIDARLAESLRLGCDLAVVLTEPGSPSQRNLERAGFSLAYTKVLMEK